MLPQKGIDAPGIQGTQSVPEEEELALSSAARVARDRKDENRMKKGRQKKLPNGGDWRYTGWWPAKQIWKS
jgi:hypothetical protein